VGFDFVGRLGWCLEKLVVGIYHRCAAALVTNGGEGPKGCSKVMLPFKGMCCKPSLQNLIVMGFQQHVVVDSCHTSLSQVPP
jgi:hypothetical protein